MIQKQKGQKGFTLLLAALVASIVLSIGTAVFSIAQKQVALSATGRDSQFAFYAADTGAECALYWDIRAQAFATSSSAFTAVPISCDQQTPTVTVLASSINAATSTFYYGPGNYCAQVTIAKSINLANGAINTTIHADGYSASSTPANCVPAVVGNVPSAIANGTNVLQRSVELNY